MKFNFFNKTQRRESEAALNAPYPAPASGSDYASNAVQVLNERTALKVAAFYRALELRSTTMSQLRWEYQTFDKRGQNYVEFRRGDLARRINYLLQVRPNPTMTACDWMKTAEQHIVLHGNAVTYIERDMAGDVVHLWLCSMATYNAESNSYFLSYRSDTGLVSLNGVPSRDVIHIRNTFTMEDGLVGIPTLTYAVQALSIAATNDAQTLDNAAKGGKMKLLLQENKESNFGIGGRANQKQLEKVADKLQRDVYDRDVILLNNVANVTPISQSAQQMELLSSRQFSVADIGRFMAVPLPLLNDYSNSSYKTPEASTQEFLTRTIAPKIHQWEDEVNSKLLDAVSYGSLRYHLCEMPLLRLDPKGQADIDKLHLETGVMTVNELRSQYDLPAVEKGDTHYVSTNLAEVGSKKLSGEDSGKEAAV